jgi:putative ABC transport system substrate-binding protein
MVLHPDPVGGGLAVSLARPGKNVTGLSSVTKDSVGKRLQLLKEAVPRTSRVAVLLDPRYPASALELGEAEAAARSLNLSLRVHEVRAPGDFAGAFAAMTRDRAEGLTTIGGNLFFIHRTRIVELASQGRLPSIYANKEYAESGGLMAYGPNIRDRFRRAATYVDRILKGTKPGELPIEQATSFYLTINLKTTKALGLTTPQAVLSRADELIQ